MQKTAWILLSACLFLITLGCGLGFQPDGVGGYVLIPWRDANGQYPFQRVPLLSLESPRSLQSYRAKVYYKTGANGAGFSGKAVSPNVAKKDDLWIPLDPESGLTISAFAIMERIYDFDKQMETLTNLRWPRQIGVEILVRGKDGPLTNNALYDMDLDVIALAPYHAGKTPVALNPGILAHEHFHAHFASALKGSKNGGPLRINASAPAAAVNLAVVAGWNEGLADYYAYVFTGDPDFIRATFAYKAEDRLLTGERWSLLGWQQLYSSMGCENRCRYNSDHLVYVYRNGTAIARFLYKWGSQSIDGHKRLLTHIQQRLPIVMNRLRGVLETQQVSPAYLLEDLVATSKLELNWELCEDLIWMTGQVSPSPYFGRCQ